MFIQSFCPKEMPAQSATQKLPLKTSYISNTSIVISIHQVCLIWSIQQAQDYTLCQTVYQVHKAALNTSHGTFHTFGQLLNIYTHFEETGMSVTGPMLLICSPPLDTGATGATGATLLTEETGMTGVLVVDWG